MILMTATAYLNDNILPGLATLLVAGLIWRALSKSMHAQREEDEPLKVIFKRCRKYITIAVIVTVLASLVYLIDSYF